MAICGALWAGLSQTLHDRIACTGSCCSRGRPSNAPHIGIQRSAPRCCSLDANQIKQRGTLIGRTQSAPENSGNNDVCRDHSRFKVALSVVLCSNSMVMGTLAVTFRARRRYPTSKVLGGGGGAAQSQESSVTRVSGAELTRGVKIRRRENMQTRLFRKAGGAQLIDSYGTTRDIRLWSRLPHETPTTPNKLLAQAVQSSR